MVRNILAKGSFGRVAYVRGILATVDWQDNGQGIPERDTVRIEHLEVVAP